MAVMYSTVLRCAFEYIHHVRVGVLAVADTTGPDRGHAHKTPPSGCARARACVDHRVMRRRRG